MRQLFQRQSNDTDDGRSSTLSERARVDHGWRGRSAGSPRYATAGHSGASAARSAPASRCGVALAVLFAIVSTAVRAQAGQPNVDDSNWVKVTSRAFFGEVGGPGFGVGEVKIDYAGSGRPVLPPDQPVWLFERDQRALYPAVSRVYASKDTHRLKQLTVRFLTKGTEPLHLRIVGPKTRELTVQLETNPRARKDALEGWWARYPFQFRDRVGDFPKPPVSTLETYLVSMLARRLDLTLPQKQHSWYRQNNMVFGADFEFFMEMMLGTKSIEVALQRDLLLRSKEAPEPADIPLPKATAPPALELPKTFEGAEVDALSQYVPEECFYLKCASLEHLDQVQTALGALGTVTGGVTDPVPLDQNIFGRLQQQLALRMPTGQLADIANEITELAVIGTDPFVREGAALGVILHAKQDAEKDKTGNIGQALTDRVILEWVKRERRETRKKFPAAKEQIESIAGHDVRLLSTPDNRVRSFYVAVDGHHLVTNSRAITQRFLEAARGKGSLAKLREYQYVRSTKFAHADKLPLFLYMSDPFFRNFVSPQYRIEMTRRARASAELQLVEFARLAAHREQQLPADVDSLISADLLPAGFGQRSDGSRTVLADDVVRDSLRGARGFFLPVPDVKLQGATRSEIDAYKSFTQQYASNWTRTDPVAIGVRLEPAGQRNGQPLMKLVFDISVAPFARRHYGFIAQWLPEPSKTQVTFPPGNLVSLTTVAPPFFLRGNAANRKAGHLYVGLRDMAINVAFKNGRIVADDRDFEDGPWYYGHASALGLLELMYPNIDWDDRDVDGEGYIKHNREWHRAWNDTFVAIARQKETLQAVTPHLKLAQGEREAQIRFEIADLATSKIAPALTTAAWAYSRVGSAHTAESLNHYGQQFALEADAVLPAFQRAMDGQPVCSLGGNWQQPQPKKSPEFVSNHWPQPSLYTETGSPQGYLHPFIHGLRGTKVELTLYKETLTSHIELLLPAPK